MIIGRDQQHAMGKDILFSTQQLRWDGVDVPIQTENSKFVDLDTLNSCNKSIVDLQ
jgi:hypothetical protein